jgi:hypothetical protein
MSVAVVTVIKTPPWLRSSMRRTHTAVFDGLEYVTAECPARSDARDA